MRDPSLLKLSKGDHTKVNIILKYIELMGQKKWDRITVKELCAASNITRGTFYQYFDDIYDLMDNIQNFLLDELRREYKECEPFVSTTTSVSDPSMQHHFNTDIPPIFKAWFRFCKDNDDVMLALASEDRGEPYFKKKLKKIVVAELDHMMDSDGLPRDSLRTHFQDLYFSMHYHSMIIWLTSEASGSPEKAISIDRMAAALNTVRVGAMYDHYHETIH